MRLSTLQLIQRIFTLIGFMALVGVLLIIAQLLGYQVPGFGNQNDDFDEPKPQVAIISGHAGFDSGAVCLDADDNPVLTEADLNAQIAMKVVEQMRRENVETLLLDEYDDRLDGLQTDLLLSLHIDSCIPASGYKAAYSEKSVIPEEDQRLVSCIDSHYPQATGITYHADTLTHDMFGYHAFNQIQPKIPAAILEMGFLGGDQQLLVNQQDRIVQGIVESLLCFLNDEVADDKTPQVVEETE